MFGPLSRANRIFSLYVIVVHLFRAVLLTFFPAGLYASELNPSNPLSTGGDLAKSYANLLEALFAKNSYCSTFRPRRFKSSIARHALIFTGYQEQDTQELLAFLLDGLHEDLNRVLKKPYIERPEWEGGGLKEIIKLANDNWEGYKKRNDSVIVDLFQGQYKSTLACSECEQVSISTYLPAARPFRISIPF